MLRPAWLCHQRRAVGFSVAQFQPDFIFDAVRGLFSPLLVGVAPAIPTTPSNLDADCIAIFNRVMIGGLHADLAQHGLTIHDVAHYAQTLPSPSDSGGATPTPHRHDHKGQVHHAGEVNDDPMVGIHPADVH